MCSAAKPRVPTVGSAPPPASTQGNLKGLTQVGDYTSLTLVVPALLCFGWLPALLGLLSSSSWAWIVRDD